ncbi:hypothetical protein DFH06DRAFT_1125230 [Mycena polygramma]|nr:hypothetical protein DFH06DRAFT_1125230 [Mycena polygramma]
MKLGKVGVTEKGGSEKLARRETDGDVVEGQSTVRYQEKIWNALWRRGNCGEEGGPRLQAEGGEGEGQGKKNVWIARTIRDVNMDGKCPRRTLNPTVPGRMREDTRIGETALRRSSCQPRMNANRARDDSAATVVVRSIAKDSAACKGEGMGEGWGGWGRKYDTAGGTMEREAERGGKDAAHLGRTRLPRMGPDSAPANGTAEGVRGSSAVLQRAKYEPSWAQNVGETGAEHGWRGIRRRGCGAAWRGGASDDEPIELAPGAGRAAGGATAPGVVHGGGKEGKLRRVVIRAERAATHRQTNASRRADSDGGVKWRRDIEGAADDVGRRGDAGYKAAPDGAGRRRTVQGTAQGGSGDGAGMAQGRRRDGAGTAQGDAEDRAGRRTGKSTGDGDVTEKLNVEQENATRRTRFGHVEKVSGYSCTHRRRKIEVHSIAQTIRLAPFFLDAPWGQEDGISENYGVPGISVCGGSIIRGKGQEVGRGGYSIRRIDLGGFQDAKRTGRHRFWVGIGPAPWSIWNGAANCPKFCGG